MSSGDPIHPNINPIVEDRGIGDWVIANRAQVIARLDQHRARGEKIVFTNGCFDLLHIGHTRYLEQARALGDVLVVGLNSDRSVKRLKGELRPIVPEGERAEMLVALRAVSYVCIFDEETPAELIREVRPDLLVKGGDWPVNEIVGHDFVAANGGETRSLPYVPNHSTTEILDRVATALRLSGSTPRGD